MVKNDSTEGGSKLGVHREHIFLTMPNTKDRWSVGTVKNQGARSVKLAWSKMAVLVEGSWHGQSRQLAWSNFM
jgi:hypothetical protein